MTSTVLNPRDPAPAVDLDFLSAPVDYDAQTTPWLQAALSEVAAQLGDHLDVDDLPTGSHGYVCQIMRGRLAAALLRRGVRQAPAGPLSLAALQVLRGAELVRWPYSVAHVVDAQGASAHAVTELALCGLITHRGGWIYVVTSSGMSVRGRLL